MRAFVQRFDRLVSNVCRVVRGKDEVVRQAVGCVLAEGHLLIEDVPGVGKTSLARSIAASVALTWNRIQFTPDLLPSDVTGISVFDQATSTFSFRPGPVFANIVLGDEINRASPKTQSALLEVMQERTVTTDATVYRVPRPFVVVATQNPIDLEGTYALPEAQLDRFLMRIEIGYPSPQQEALVLRAEKDEPVVASLAPVMTGDELLDLVEVVKCNVEVSGSLEDYIVAICGETRNRPDVRLGVSPRGGIALLRAARVVAAAEGRSYASPDDVKAMARPTLAHRIIMRPEAELRGVSAYDIASSREVCRRQRFRCG
jgi:MoxR-like ATPase